MQVTYYQIKNKIMTSLQNEQIASFVTLKPITKSITLDNNNELIVGGPGDNLVTWEAIFRSFTNIQNISRWLLGQ
jgi:hypothetical protein